MDRDRTNRVINPQELQQVQAPDHHTASNQADEEGTYRINPVTRTGNGNQSSQETVDRQAQVPLLRANVGVE